MRGLTLFLVSLAPVVAATADEPPGPQALLVSFDELQRRLDEPGLRILDVRPEADYQRGHVPGAVWFNVKPAEKLAAKPGGLEDAAAWSRLLAPLGITAETTILVYDAHRQLDAARVWWLLRYLGFDRAGLVNGGYGLWEKEARPTSQAVPTVAAQAIDLKPRRARLATRQDVLEAVRSAGASQVVDARSREEYTGAVAKSSRGGRIPEACHLEWTKFVDADGRFLDDSALRELVAHAGVRPGQPVITHCQGGGRASVDAFVFERLGFPTRNYYLGWSDWGNAEDTPVQGP